MALPTSFSSDLSPAPSTPSSNYTQCRPSTPEGHTQSSDIFMTPRAQHVDQLSTDAPQEEGLCTRPTPQGGNPEGPRGPGLSWNLTERIAAPASTIAGGLDDPFRSEGTGLTRNLARRLDDSVPFFAVTAMNMEVNC